MLNQCDCQSYDWKGEYELFFSINTVFLDWDLACSILIIVSMIRELLGSGQLYGYQIIPLSIYANQGGWYMDNGLMLLAPGAFIVLGLLIWAQRAYTGFIEE